MLEFILNDRKITTAAPSGTAMLDFIRKERRLTGSKLVCKEGECGACSVLVGTLKNGKIEYQSMTSCIMPLVNAHGKHIVTIEGLNMENLSPIQQAMVNEYGSQCGFCTPGFVVSLTGYLLSVPADKSEKSFSTEGIIAAIDGNICRCTGYKSIERAAEAILQNVKSKVENSNLESLISNGFIPGYFSEVVEKLKNITSKSNPEGRGRKLGGGTDLYVQRPYEMYETEATPVYDLPEMKAIEIQNGKCIFGSSMTMGDLARSEIFAKALPDSKYIFKLLSSTQIRNMSTIGGNLVNASPIGDFTILLLALDAEIVLNNDGQKRTIPLKTFYLGYKKLDLKKGEVLEKIKFKLPGEQTVFHFEKVSQRKYFDIASVNFASKIEVENNVINEANMAVGGVGPIPTFLHKTSDFLKDKKLTPELIDSAFKILQTEISPISDARGSATYKRLLARQLLLAQFLNINPNIYPIEQLTA